MWTDVEARRGVNGEPALGTDAIEGRLGDASPVVVERRVRPSGAERGSDLDARRHHTFGLDTRLAEVASAIVQEVDAVIREQRDRPEVVRQVQPRLKRTAVGTAHAVVVEVHPGRWRDREALPLVLVGQLGFHDLRARAVRGVSEREIAPKGKLGSAPGYPRHRLKNRPIADEKPAIRMAGPEGGLQAIGWCGVGRFLVRRFRTEGVRAGSAWRRRYQGILRRRRCAPREKDKPQCCQCGVPRALDGRGGEEQRSRLHRHG